MVTGRRITWFLLVLLLGMGNPAQAALRFWTQGDLLIISGKAETGDVEELRGKLTPEIRFVVLREVSGGPWGLAERLSDLVEKAGVTTVVHGYCRDFACSMMFLAGRQRMFSGSGRPENHYVVIQFNRLGFVTGDDHTPFRSIHAWWQRHTNLSDADLEPTSPLFYNKHTNNADTLVFFPAMAKFSGGNVLHCADESRIPGQVQHLSDCQPMPTVTARQRGIVTTDDTFTRPGVLRIRPDVSGPAPSHIAALTDTPVATLSEDCRLKYSDFLRQDSPRAFVVADDGTCSWANAQVFRPHAMAMDLCKKHSKNCRYYVIDNEVVFKPFEENALPKDGLGQDS